VRFWGWAFLPPLPPPPPPPPPQPLTHRMARTAGAGCCGNRGAAPATASSPLSSLLVASYAVLAVMLVGCVSAFMRLFSPIGFKYIPVPGPPALPYLGINTNPVFAWHPILLTVAYAALMGSALLSFQSGLAGAPSPSPRNRAWRKSVHSWLHALAGVFIGLGLAAVFTSQKAAGRPLFYTGHSWAGIASVGLYAVNFVAGAGSFLFPCTPVSVRRRMLPLHHFVGWLAFGTGLQSIASGIEEMRVLILTVYMPAGAIPPAAIPPIGVLMPLAQVLLSALIAVALAHAMLTSAGKQKAAVEAAVHHHADVGGKGAAVVGGGEQEEQRHNGVYGAAPPSAPSYATATV
jgi:hypothetical protein